MMIDEILLEQMQKYESGIWLRDYLLEFIYNQQTGNNRKWSLFLTVKSEFGCIIICRNSFAVNKRKESEIEFLLLNLKKNA